MVKRKAYIPERGDVIWISLNPQTGHEQSGRRPALVLSPSSYNSKAGLSILCPITNKIKGYPFEVLLPEGLDVIGVALSDQVKNLDWRSRKAEYMCTLPEKVILEVLGKLNTLLRKDPETSSG